MSAEDLCAVEGAPSAATGRTRPTPPLLRQSHWPGTDSAAVHALLAYLGSSMGTPRLQPGIGLLPGADPELAYPWRIAQRGTLEPGADLGVAGCDAAARWGLKRSPG
jgi:hypothetical protein